MIVNRLLRPLAFLLLFLAAPSVCFAQLDEGQIDQALGSTPLYGSRIGGRDTTGVDLLRMFFLDAEGRLYVLSDLIGITEAEADSFFTFFNDKFRQIYNAYDHSTGFIHVNAGSVGVLNDIAGVTEAEADSFWTFFNDKFRQIYNAYDSDFIYVKVGSLGVSSSDTFIVKGTVTATTPLSVQRDLQVMSVSDAIHIHEAGGVKAIRHSYFSTGVFPDSTDEIVLAGLSLVARATGEGGSGTAGARAAKLWERPLGMGVHVNAGNEVALVINVYSTSDSTIPATALATNLVARIPLYTSQIDTFAYADGTILQVVGSNNGLEIPYGTNDGVVYYSVATSDTSADGWDMVLQFLLRRADTP